MNDGRMKWIFRTSGKSVVNFEGAFKIQRNKKGAWHPRPSNTGLYFYFDYAAVSISAVYVPVRAALLHLARW